MNVKKCIKAFWGVEGWNPETSLNIAVVLMHVGQFKQGHEASTCQISLNK